MLALSIFSLWFSLTEISLSLSRANRQIKNKKAFTLVELMIVIAIIGVLAASLFPMMSSYMSRARDTARYTGAKDINLTLRMYRDDHGDYPDFGQSIGSWTSFIYSSYVHDCRIINGLPANGGWSTRITPILRQYSGKNITDINGTWPLCYMYMKPGYHECHDGYNSKPYSLVFATEASRSFLGDLYQTQSTPWMHSRYCLTGD